MNKIFFSFPRAAWEFSLVVLRRITFRGADRMGSHAELGNQKNPTPALPLSGEGAKSPPDKGGWGVLLAAPKQDRFNSMAAKLCVGTIQSGKETSCCVASIGLAIILLWVGLPSAQALEDLVRITAEQEQHIGIRTLKPEAISWIPLVRAPARVSLPPQNEYIVSAPQGGLVSRVEVALGVKIAKGQALAQIQSPNLLSLQREVLDAVTGFNLAKSKLNRDTTLLEEGIIARMRYQETRSDYERYAMALKEAEQMLTAVGVSETDIQALKQSRKLNSFMNVRSPIDGVILERMATAGQRVDLLAPLFRIGKLDELWLEINMPQERMNELRLGDHVRIENTGYTARIAHIGQSVDPGSQSALVRGIIEGKPKSIRPGQNVNVQISHASTDRLFRLPIAALASLEGKSYVFVRVPGGFSARQVAVASTEERSVVIHEGLQDGEQVVVQGIAALKASWTGIGFNE